MEKLGNHEEADGNEVLVEMLAHNLDTLTTDMGLAKLTREERVRHILSFCTHSLGFYLPGEHPDESHTALEINTEKQWGGYVTLEKQESPEGDIVRKILVVNPLPKEIPEDWDFDQPFFSEMAKIIGRRGVALSVQRHHQRIKENWTVVHGEGYHVTSYSEDAEPDIDSFTFTRINKSGNNQVEHKEATWHTVMNTGTEPLVIVETIRCKPGQPHSESDIDRAYDLFGRKGTNKNI